MRATLELYKAEKYLQANPDATALDLAREFNISPPEARRWMQRIQDGRLPPPRWEVVPAKGKELLIKREILAAILADYPRASLRNLRDEYWRRTGIEVTTMGIRFAVRPKDASQDGGAETE